MTALDAAALKRELEGGVAGLAQYAANVNSPLP
jgi:hypothetical protein